MSRDGDKGNTPPRPMAPREVLSSTRPQKQAGILTDPPVSLPSATGANPPATATPDPLDDPPGARWTARSQGLHGVPVTGSCPAAIGELDRLRLADHDHPRRLEPPHRGGGRRRRRPGS